MKRITYRAAPAYIRGAIRQAADRWQTTDGVPLGELLDSEEPPTHEACPDCKADEGVPCHIDCSSRWT